MTSNKSNPTNFVLLNPNKESN